MIVTLSLCDFVTKLWKEAYILKKRALTTIEATLLFARKGFHVRVEKKGKFFHDWFILVAKHKRS